MKLLIPILLLAATIAQAKPIATTASPLIIAYQKLKHPEKAITNEQAKAILKEMQQQRNDEEKIAIIKAKLNDKEVGITVNQLVTLLNQFLTDDSKLAAAKYAFEYTTNYKSYLNMINLFGREEYKDALEDFYKKNK
jgi:folylpolyglutamate synthase/dihydropteroate synthase